MAEPAIDMKGSVVEKARLVEADHRCLWHPFTQMKDWMASEPVIIVSGQGVRLRDINGKEYYDGNSSMWVNIHGHRKAALDQALLEQAGRIAHSTMLGLANVPAIMLAERLVSLAPAGLTRVFYSDNGSTAVEVALKMAFQYWQHRGERRRKKFVHLQHAYHGDTLGAVSVGGISLYHEVFRPLLAPGYEAPSPYCYRCPLGMEYEGGRCGLQCAEVMGDILRWHGDEVAAVIIEPLVQAAGGMITSPPGYLKRVRQLCDHHGVLLIADEVATGFGRTGRIFACEHEGVSPDIMALSKGITGGYLPLGATLATEEVFSAFLGEYREAKTFFHGHSYTGNQLACAVALANLDVFEEEGVLAHVQRISAYVQKALEGFKDLAHVGDIRQRGLMVGIELVRDKASREPYRWEEAIGVRVCRKATEMGMITRPLGNVVVFMPPLASTEADVREMISILWRAIISVTEGTGGDLERGSGGAGNGAKEA